jgi:cysteine synthase A
MLPDTGERYLSTPLFEDISEEMTEAEIALSCSTPNYRFDRPAPAAAAGSTAPPTLNPAAEAFVSATVAAAPVVMFALEWCEFCWSVRKLFAAMDIPYESVDLGCGAFEHGDMGGKIRAVLAERTGSATIPQIYVGGYHMGGCTDLFDACRVGNLQRKLEDAGVNFARDVTIDPYSLLPRWLHPRRSA